jgi:hypothetical protein
MLKAFTWPRRGRCWLHNRLSKKIVQRHFIVAPVTPDYGFQLSSNLRIFLFGQLMLSSEIWRNDAECFDNIQQSWTFYRGNTKMSLLQKTSGSIESWD